METSYTVKTCARPLSRHGKMKEDLSGNDKEEI